MSNAELLLDHNKKPSERGRFDNLFKNLLEEI